MFPPPFLNGEGKDGPVVQLVRTLACHARGRRFEPVPGRHFFLYASVAQSVEQRTENPRVDGSIPSGSTICGFSSSGRAPPCQGGGSGFEPRNPLHFFIWRHSQVVRQRSAKPLCPSSNLGGASTKKPCGKPQGFCLVAVGGIVSEILYFQRGTP